MELRPAPPDGRYYLRDTAEVETEIYPIPYTVTADATPPSTVAEGHLSMLQAQTWKRRAAGVARFRFSE